jgi:DNA-binding IclR family transcriptional regulator
MQEFHREHPDRDGLISSIDLRAIGKAQGLTRSRVREAVEGLERYGWVRQAAGGVRFISEET